MTIRVINRTLTPTAEHKPLPELRRKRSFGWKTLLFLLCSMYLAIALTWLSLRYTSAAPPIPPQEQSFPDLRERLLESQLSRIELLQLDPRGARAVAKKGVELADELKLDRNLVLRKAENLELPNTIDPNWNMEILSVEKDTPVVIIEVTVKDRQGAFVDSLRRVDFEVGQGNTRFKHVGFSRSVRSGRPPDVVILIDTSGSTTGAPFQSSMLAAERLIQLVHSNSRIKIWSFASDVQALTGWSSDKLGLIASLKKLRADGGTALNKAIKLAVEDASLKDGTTTLVLFTDGSDSFNNVPLQPILNQARNEGIAIHVVALKTGETKEVVLREIAQTTGGTLHMVQRHEELIREFELVAGQLTEPVYRLAIVEKLDVTQPIKLKVGSLRPIEASITTR